MSDYRTIRRPRREIEIETADPTEIPDDEDPNLKPYAGIPRGLDDLGRETERLGKLLAVLRDRLEDVLLEDEGHAENPDAVEATVVGSPLADRLERIVDEYRRYLGALDRLVARIDL